MNQKSFVVKLEESANAEFSKLSGDWNPIHCNATYAKKSGFSGPVLHGAYSAALISRLAGMYLPGTHCLLQRLQINFLRPIVPPVELEVRGKQISENKHSNRVEVEILDRQLGILFCNGSYDFSEQIKVDTDAPSKNKKNLSKKRERPHQPTKQILLTGASGGIGQSIAAELGHSIIPLPHTVLEDGLANNSLSSIQKALGNNSCDGIIMCGWPKPDDGPLISRKSLEIEIESHLTSPLRTAVLLAQVLTEFGTPNSPLIIIGSTFSKAGKHAWGHPLYSLGKSLIPTLVQILGIELGIKNQKVIGIEFDVLDGGMNAGISELSKQLNRDRSPFGRIGTTSEAAKNITWLLSNSSYLVNGSTITLNGGALP